MKLSTYFLTACLAVAGLLAPALAENASADFEKKISSKKKQQKKKRKKDKEKRIKKKMLILCPCSKHLR